MQNLSDFSKWFLDFSQTAEGRSFADHPVAYFCAEYALDSSLPIYAGGLGVLAGDFIKEASNKKFPLVGVGLFYQKAQSILAGAKKEKKVLPILDENGEVVKVYLSLDGRKVGVRAWLWQEEKNPVYLLDTNIPENDPRDQTLTCCLYDENRDVRLKQEIILGIGGFRMLARLGYHASVYHLNEGHSAFLALELVRHEIEHQGVAFKEACQYAKQHILFTNHTLVPEGQEQFSAEKISLFMGKYAEEIGIKSEEIVELGSSKSRPDLFSMTNLSFRLSSKANGVSKFHAEKASQVWPEHPMESITNGVFVERWGKIKDEDEEALWEEHLKNKNQLLKLAEAHGARHWQEKDFLLVWARRLVEYKQPLLLLEKADRLAEIIKNSSVPIRMVFSGPTGEQENPFVLKIKEIIEEKFKENAVFVPNYSLETAEILTAGADVWLNTPLPGTEACGTSGMKAGLNGVPSLSTRDGWVHEINPEDVGWVANHLDSEELFALLEKDILPLYAECLENPKGSEWVKKMLKVRHLVLTDFSASRVLREYIEKMYIPISKQKHAHKFS